MGPNSQIIKLNIFEYDCRYDVHLHLLRFFSLIAISKQFFLLYLIWIFLSINRLF